MQSKRGNINVKLVFAKNILVYSNNILDKKLHLIWVNIRKPRYVERIVLDFNGMTFIPLLVPHTRASPIYIKHWFGHVYLHKLN